MLSCVIDEYGPPVATPAEPEPAGRPVDPSVDSPVDSSVEPVGRPVEPSSVASIAERARQRTIASSPSTPSLRDWDRDETPDGSGLTPPLPDLARDPDDSAAITALTDKQFRVLTCLLNSTPGESLPEVARRARTTSTVILKFLRDPTFARLYAYEVDTLMGSRRAAIAQRLMDIAENPERSDHLAGIKEYFNRLDGIKIDVNVHSNGDTFPWHVIGIETRRKILEELEEAAKAGKLDRALAGKLLGTESTPVSSDGGEEVLDGEILA